MNRYTKMVVIFAIIASLNLSATISETQLPPKTKEKKESTLTFWKSIASTCLTALPVGIASGILSKGFVSWLERQPNGLIDPILRTIEPNLPPREPSFLDKLLLGKHAYAYTKNQWAFTLKEEQLIFKFLVCYCILPLLRNAAISAIGNQAKKADAPYDINMAHILAYASDWVVYLQEENNS